MTDHVLIDAEACEALQRRAARDYPMETCGLLLGERASGRVVVRRALRLRNRADTGQRTRRYRIAPEDYLRCERRARGAGLDVVGVWHSHPDGVAVPSPADTRLAWPRWCYLVAAVDDAGVNALRAWTLQAQCFCELELRPCPR